MTDERQSDSRAEPRHLGLSRRSAGTIMVAIAYVGFVSALVGAVVGWSFLGELSDANKQGLVLAEESLTAADASLDVADEIIEAVDGSLGTLSGTIAAVGDGVATTTDVAGSTAELAAALPVTLDRIDSGLASVESIAITIDNTLSQLSRVPLAPDYDPDVPLGEAIGDLRADLAPLSGNVQAVADDLGTFSTSSDELEAQLNDLAASVTDVQSAVGGTTEVIAQARTSTNDAQALAQTTLSEIGSQLTLTRLLLVIITIAIAIGQIVPYWIGRELRAAPVLVVADASELDEIGQVIQLDRDPA